MWDLTKVKADVLALLGNNSITVEIETDDWNVIVDEALNIYNKYRPKVLEKKLSIIKGKQDYFLDIKIAGRGVHDYVAQASTDVPGVFPTTYYPLNANNEHNVNLANYLAWRTNFEAERMIAGNDDDFRWYEDSRIFRVYPLPGATFTATLVTLHNRALLENSSVITGDGSQTQFTINVKDGRNDVCNILPFRFRLEKADATEYIIDDGSGNLVSDDIAISNSTIDYVNGVLVVNFDVAPAQDVTYDLIINEVNENDYQWFIKYCYAMACVVVGNKRSRFKNYPGTQHSVDLDYEKVQEGIDQIEVLKEEAQGFVASWLIPRIE